MTAALVTPAEVTAWVFSSQPENEPLLERLAALATGIVLDYVGPDPVTLLPREWTEETVPDPVRVAILLVVAELWAHRGDAAPPELMAGADLGQLAPGVTRLLQRFRQPVVS